MSHDSVKTSLFNNDNNNFNNFFNNELAFFQSFRHYSTPVPVSGTVDKDTRPRRSRVSLLSLFCISLLCLQ